METLFDTPIPIPWLLLAGGVHWAIIGIVLAAGRKAPALKEGILLEP